MIHYLTNGRAIYIEGNNSTYDHQQTALFNYLGIYHISKGASSGIGNIQTLTGRSNSIVSDLEFEYAYKTNADEQNDTFESETGRILFQSQDLSVRAVCDGGSTPYRMILATFIFGALKDGSGINTKYELMDRYLRYLLNESRLSTQHESKPEESISIANFPNPFNHSTTLRFVLDRRQPIQLTLYDIRGKQMAQWINGEYDAGSHQVTFEAKTWASGLYTVVLQGDSETKTHKILLNK